MIIKKNAQKQVKSEVKPEIKQLENETAKEDEESIDLFNLDNIDFKQRQEHRRGDRRRGFRRIDDRNLISRAREEAITIKESAAKEGYQKGVEDAKSDLEELKSSISNFMSAKQEVFDCIIPNILEISVDIAKKIIKQEITEDPQIIINNITDILNAISKDENKVTIAVNPIQVDLLKQEVPTVAENIGLDAKIIVIPDETVLEGGCMVTTTNGIIDATIETQLAIISEALKEI